MNKLENLLKQHRQLCYSVNITAQNIPSTDNSTNNNGSSRADNNNNCNGGNSLNNRSPNVTNNSNNSSTASIELTPPSQTNIQIKSKSQSGTPTDVQDVKF